MSYQVIARKYRPQRFQDVVGQDHVTQTLANAIRQHRIAHAYLFVGPRGTGKTTLARIFAKCLNCTGGPKVDFAADDPKANEIAEGRSLDVLEIDGASNRGIEEIRELRDTVKYAPASSPFKIYIIDEVHMLTKEAFNALLKTLEEPPAHVKFMFATTEPEKVLPTILSRCQRFDLRRIPARLIVDHLGWIARQENVQIDENALFAIARGADGGMRDAESTLDQLISFCGENITETDVLSMFGLAARQQILALARHLLDGAAEPALRELSDLARHGKDLSRLLNDLLHHFRNLLLYHISKGDTALLEVSEAEAAELKAQGSLVDEAALTRILEVLADHEGRLRDAMSKRILLEVTLLKAIEARNAVPIESVLETLKSLRAEESSRAPAPPRPAATSEGSAHRQPMPSMEPTTPAAITPSLESPRRTKPVSSPGLTTAAKASSAPDNDLSKLWAELVEAVGRVSAFTKSYLIEAHPVSAAGNVLTIGFDPEFADHLGLVDNMKTHSVLQTKLRELRSGEWQIKFIQAPAPATWQRPAATPPPPRESGETTGDSPAVSVPAGPVSSRSAVSKEDFKNDPLIREALEIFKGTIVEVRS